MLTMVLCKTYSVAVDYVDLPSPLLLLYSTTENPILRLTTRLNEKNDNNYNILNKNLIFNFI